jgi:histone acetyltransferase (RNA polymerase elongator complex component)
VEIAFFGGNFTGLPQNEQEAYLKAAAKWVEAGKINGIRISTRPDYINGQVLGLLKSYGVISVELGAQSLDEDVLRLAGRGHSAKHVEEASKMMLDAGFVLGLQMMIGLPGDTLEKNMHTARRIAELGASETRIYPTLVIRGTQLEQMYLEGSYQPLSLDETIDRCKQLLLFFEDRKVKVLRLGLHPSEGLNQGPDLVAGPFHPALKELVTTAIWKEIFRETVKNKKENCLILTVAPKELNAAIGHKAANKKSLLKHFEKVEFKTNTNLTGRAFHADYC